MHYKDVACALAGVVLLGLAHAVAAEPRHVIVMIADGASFNTWRMASLYEGKVGAQPYEQDGFVRYPATTYPLNTSSTPTGGLAQRPNLAYSPEKAWDVTPLPMPASQPANSKTLPSTFGGYRFLKNSPTDSAAAATALSTGTKVYNNSINWSNDPAKTGAPLKCISEYARENGRSAGVVTTVPFNHATPAGFGAHNISRNNYQAMAKEMLSSDLLTVIMGAGHPDFDNNGRPMRESKYDFIDKETWTSVKASTDAGQPFNGFTVISSRQQFEDLASTANPPARVFGLAQAANTLQQSRDGYSSEEQVNQSPRNPAVPDLATMTNGALNVLSRNPNGFSLMIEGGAVDWAAHGNQTARAIEEFIDFNRATQVVIDFVDRPGDSIDWSNTLLVVTTDHGNGLPLGPNSLTSFFSPLQDNGAGKIPGVVWHHNSHTSELVPTFARGMGSELFAKLTDGQDSQYRSMYGLDPRWPDRYIDNTDVFLVCKYVITGEVPAAAK